MIAMLRRLAPLNRDAQKVILVVAVDSNALT